MRVGLVTTYPPAPCGIGRYAQHLRRALQAAGTEVVVAAERLVAPAAREPAADEPGVERVWHRREDWGAQVVAWARRARPDVVHLQHEESHYGQDGRVPALVATLAREGLAVVVTLHSVYAGWLRSPSEWAPRRFHQAIARAGSFIVHQHAGCASVLLDQGIAADRVHVIPHGTALVALPPRGEARRELGLPEDARLALFFGFLHAKKGVHVAVRAFTDVAARVPGARLLVAGQARQRTLRDRLYLARLRRAMRPGLAAGTIDFRLGFVADAEVATYLGAADLLVLPHRQRYGSASGVLHLALGAGKPFVCTAGPKFVEAAEDMAAAIPEAFVPEGDVDAWSRSIAKLLGDDTLRARAAERARALGERTSWPAVAASHVAAYEAALASDAAALQLPAREVRVEAVRGAGGARDAPQVEE